jgi:hypothetical protein
LKEIEVIYIETWKKYNKGETSNVRYVAVKTKYLADLESEKNMVDLGPYLE